MVSDCECPFCKQDFNIDEPIGEDESYETQCPHCERDLVVTASVIVTYETRCGDSEHDVVPSQDHPGWENCRRCDLFRKIRE